MPAVSDGPDCVLVRRAAAMSGWREAPPRRNVHSTVAAQTGGELAGLPVPYTPALTLELPTLEVYPQPSGYAWCHMAIQGVNG